MEGKSGVYLCAKKAVKAVVSNEGSDQLRSKENQKLKHEKKQTQANDRQCEHVYM